MRQALKKDQFLVVMALVAAADLALWYAKVPQIFWVEFTYITALVALLAGEVIRPRNAAWNYITPNGIKSRELSADLFFLLLQGLVTSVAILQSGIWISDHLRHLLGLTFSWSIHWVFQCVIAVFVVDLLRYWIHRCSHQVSWLWRFHSLHHMPERLGAMATARTNPIDDFITYLPELVVLFTLGFDQAVILGLYSFIWVVPLISHSNVEFNETGFSRHFQLPRYHLIHHAYNDGVVPTFNFCEILTFWDRVFGTFKGDPIGLDHRTGVATNEPRTWVREFLGWLYLPVRRL